MPVEILRFITSTNPDSPLPSFDTSPASSGKLAMWSRFRQVALLGIQLIWTADFQNALSFASREKDKSVMNATNRKFLALLQELETAGDDGVDGGDKLRQRGGVDWIIAKGRVSRSPSKSTSSTTIPRHSMGLA